MKLSEFWRQMFWIVLLFFYEFHQISLYLKQGGQKCKTYSLWLLLSGQIGQVEHTPFWCRCRPAATFIIRQCFYFFMLRCLGSLIIGVVLYTLILRVVYFLAIFRLQHCKNSLPLILIPYSSLCLAISILKVFQFLLFLTHHMFV